MVDPAHRWRSPPPDADRARVLGLLRQHGGGPAAFQILEQPFRYWFEGTTAVVGYVEAAGHWVAAGPPVAPPLRIAQVASAFAAAAAAAGCRAAFFGVEPTFLAALEQAGVAHGRLPIGQQPDWDPAGYSLEGPRRRTLRAQVNRAHNKGIQVRRLSACEVGGNAPRRAAIEHILERWVDARRMAVMRFMVDLEPFTFPEERRYYLAERAGQAVGFLAAIPVFDRRGWYIEDLIRLPDAPNGTAELLVHTALTEAGAAGDGYLTLGLAPLAQIPRGPGPHRWLRGTLRLCAAHLSWLYPFTGVYAFKARFRPDRWTPHYLVSLPTPVRLRTVHALLVAFAGRGLPSFAWATLKHMVRRLVRRRPSAARAADATTRPPDEVVRP